MKLTNLVLGFALIAGAVSALAFQVRITDPIKYANQATLNYGQELSDWNQAKVLGCENRPLNGKVDVRCQGISKTMGPGGSGPFKTSYMCTFSFLREASNSFIQTEKNCN